VVTYNRKQLLLECLGALLKQTHPLDSVYLIDNASTDGTPELLKEKGYIKDILNLQNSPFESEYITNMQSKGNQDKPVKIHYVRMHENTGGAGGFYEGVKRAYEKGYDWLWLMDDDAEPVYDSLENLFSSILGAKSKVLALASLKTDALSFLLSKYISNSQLDRLSFDDCTFVGLFISREVVNEIGLPEKRFFIWCDDVEYCYRIVKKCGGVFLDKSSIIKHKVGCYKEQKMIFKFSSHRNDISDFWKTYYGFRNSIYSARKHNSLRFYLTLVLFLRRTIGILVFDDHKVIRMNIMLHGIIDGLLLRIDRRLDLREWKESRKIRYTKSQCPIN
jgi:GT2 family glycosyltransferase